MEISMTIHISPNGMKTFSLIWLGQLVSIAGSGLSEFALALWVYQRTESVMQFAFVFVFKALPTILISPLAGALIDRWDRRKIMIWGDTGAALSTLAVAALLFLGRLETWHIYLATMISSTFGAFQVPAYICTTS